MRVATEAGAASTTGTRARMLDGMRLAIDQEIAAVTAREPRSAPRVARNGRLTLLMNGQQIYTFEVEQPWEVPADTFVRVSIPNAEPLVASVELSGRGMASSTANRPSAHIALDTEQKLPPDALAETRLQLHPAQLLRKLRDALDTASDGHRQLASKAFGLLAIESFGATAIPHIPGFEPGEAQRRALEMAQSHEVLYVVGPPGTGKTRTLAAMAHHFMRQGWSVLIAAQTNIAVDNALEQLALLCEGSSDGLGLPAGTVVRCGEPHLPALRLRPGVSLPALAASSLLQKTQTEAATRELERAAAREARGKAIVAWEQAARECEALEAAPAPHKGIFGKLRARGKQHPREEEKARAARIREELARELLVHEGRLGAAEQKRGLTRRKLQALQSYAARVGAEMVRDETPTADDGGAPEPEEVTPELARELFVEERRILGEARVVGATLAKTYMAKALQGRRFDVVIVDEASMAPLPALYVAATRANQRLILIGDPRQLRPIVKSKEPVALEWLGRDVFTAAGLDLKAAHAGTSHAVMLDEQRRMRPEVSGVARRHVYDNLLRDHPDVALLPAPRIEPLPDRPLVLCDTSDAGPVCSRPSASRVNIYHAICTFLLGLRALRSLGNGAPSPSSVEDRLRVALITPYRKQAELLQRLIRLFDLEHAMRAGTVHRFQGLECDVVVFDTVESEGLSLTPLTAGGAGTEAQRLTNVAITRGRHKLIVVANQDHLRRRLAGGPDGNVAAGRHTLWDAVREAAASAVVDSRTLIALDVEAASEPDGVILGAIARLAQMFAPLTGSEFDARLRDDVARAQRDVLIVSPYVTERRVREVLPMVREALGRGVRVRVVTGRRSANRNDRVSGPALARLIEAGVEHRERPGLHQKVVFVDEAIAYVGSLNALSFSGATQELMLRIDDLKLARSLRRHFE